ncbi:MAG: hydroxymethylglutaryl-CoA lyase [Pseudomonadota bacterium]
MGEKLSIFEVGPRDGLQNEPRPIPTVGKIALVDALSASGLNAIEVTSFVSARWIPQLADAADVLMGIRRSGGVCYSALTPNMRGFEAALAADVDMIAVFAAATESFSQRNINCSIDESFARFAPVIEAARKDAVPVRAYVSCVTDCPFEGPVEPGAVAHIAARFAAAGVAQISLGETLGRARAPAVSAMLEAVLTEVPCGLLAGHFHDTSGAALENVAIAAEKGLRVFDSAAGGLGGCPYAPGAAGNLATERLLDWALAQGFDTGVDPVALERAAALAKELKMGQSDVV